MSTFVWDKRFLEQYPGAIVIQPGPMLARKRGSAAPFLFAAGYGEIRPVEHINPSELDRNLTVDEVENP